MPESLSKDVTNANAQVFKALDFVLVEARRYGLRIILSVLDNWKYSGGSPASAALLPVLHCCGPCQISNNSALPRGCDGTCSLHAADSATAWVRLEQ